MNKPWLPCWFVASLSLIGTVLPAYAQDEPRQYKKFDISPDFEKLFKQRLDMENQLGPFKDLIKQIAADPSRIPVNPEHLKKLKIDDNTKKAIKDWATNDPQLRDALKDWMKKHPSGEQTPDMKKFQDGLKAILDKPPPKNDLKVELKPIQSKIPSANPEPLAKVTERAMKRAEETKLGDWLRDSPAWNRAFEELRTSVGKPNTSSIKLGDWQNKLPDTDGWLGRLRELPRPELGRWTPTLPTFDGFASPNISAPSLPATPAMPSVGTWTTWLLLSVVGLLITWQMMRWKRRARKPADARAVLGPWPVQPNAISTRAELVQAFDYLALLTLGLGVQCWNHHAVARQWRTLAPTCAVLAQALAVLYEQARYTDGIETLSDGDRDQARRSLAQIAEAF